MKLPYKKVKTSQFTLALFVVALAVGFTINPVFGFLLGFLAALLPNVYFCPNCGQDMPKSILLCRSCKQRFRPQSMNVLILIVLAVFIVIILDYYGLLGFSARK